LSEGIRVVVADQQSLIRIGLRTTLLEAGDIAVTGEAADGVQATRISERLAPDVLLIALGLPGPPVAEVVARLRASSPVRALVLAEEDPVHVNSLIRAGAAGCIVKDEAPKHAVQAVRAIASGMTWFSQAAMAMVAHSEPPTSLTKREAEVLALVAEGWTNLRIAHELGIGERTVRFHLENLFGRLRADNRLAAVLAAQRQGLLPVCEPVSAS
jgi:DNA-binding NarL/FixJ family response regulator